MPVTRNSPGIGNPARQQRHRRDCREHHRQCVDDVVGGDRAGAVVGGAGCLQQHVGRHNEKPARRRNAEQVGEDAPMRGNAERNMPRPASGRPGQGRVRGRQPQIDREQRNAERSPRDRAGGNPAAKDMAA